MKSRQRFALRVLLVAVLTTFGIVAAAPQGEALPPGETGGQCYNCRWWPFLGSMCWHANAGRSECDEYPSQSCWPHGAFCEIINVPG